MRTRHALYLLPFCHKTAQETFCVAVGSLRLWWSEHNWRKLVLFGSECEGRWVLPVCAGNRASQMVTGLQLHDSPFCTTQQLNLHWVTKEKTSPLPKREQVFTRPNSAHFYDFVGNASKSHRLLCPDNVKKNSNQGKISPCWHLHLDPVSSDCLIRATRWRKSICLSIPQKTSQLRALKWRPFILQCWNHAFTSQDTMKWSSKNSRLQNANVHVSMDVTSLLWQESVSSPITMVELIQVEAKEPFLAIVIFGSTKCLCGVLRLTKIEF